ncbi:MAG: hypothetical protein AAF546_07050 [Verrucomicrobiota bacterium]
MAEQVENHFDWKGAIHETYVDLSRNVIDFAPEFLGAAALLGVGWILAHILKLATRKLIQSFDSVFKRATRSHDGHREQIEQYYTLILSQVVYWAVILFFVTASANLIGWEMFSDWMDRLIQFLPNMLTGLLIILGGFLLSSATYSAVLTAGRNARVTQTLSLARTAQITILVSAVIIGAEQIGLHVQFLTTALIVIVGVLLAGACLAFGLGAKTIVANTIGAQYTRKHCSVGEHLKVGEYEGEILEVTRTNIVLDTEKGRAILPAKLFQEEACILVQLGENENGNQHASDTRGEGGKS